MAYNPFVRPTPWMAEAPDESALLSPAYRNPFFFQGAGQIPSPYYNPFQGAYASAPSVQAPAAAPAPEAPAVRNLTQEYHQEDDEAQIAQERNRWLNREVKPVSGLHQSRGPSGIPGSIGKGLDAVSNFSLNHQNQKIIDGKGIGYDWGGYRFTLHEGPLEGSTVVSGTLPPGVSVRDAINATGYTQGAAAQAAQQRGDPVAQRENLQAAAQRQTAAATAAAQRQAQAEDDGDREAAQRAQQERARAAESARYSAMAAYYGQGDNNDSDPGHGSPVTDSSGNAVTDSSGNPVTSNKGGLIYRSKK